jgi:hypothetical protein
MGTCTARRTATIRRVPMYVPSQKEIAQEQARLTDPLWLEARPILLELVAQLRAAKTVEEMWELQIKLISQVRGRQQILTEMRAELDRWRGKRGKLAAQSPKPREEIIELQRRITWREHQVRVQDGLRHVLLAIGDGLAWKAMGYDRAAITILGHGHRVAWLSDGPGWRAEAAALGEQRDAGHFALLNDLTTCLRNGDVTVFERDRRTVYEVKAGTKTDDRAPQMVRLEQVVNFVNTGRSEIEGYEGGYLRCPRRYRTHLAQVGPLLERATKTGSAWGMVSPCQFVVAHDMRFFADAENLPKLAGVEEARAATGWPESDIVLDHSTTVRRMRDRHHSFATLAPLSIFPLSPEQVTDLLHGWLNVTTLLNVSLLARSLAAHGILAEAIGPPEAQSAFMNVLKQTGPTTAMKAVVAPHQREMMLLELMTPATLRAGIETMVEFMAGGSLDPERQMVFWSEEAATWDRAVP